MEFVGVAKGGKVALGALADGAQIANAAQSLHLVGGDLVGDHLFGGLGVNEGPWCCGKIGGGGALAVLVYGHDAVKAAIVAVAKDVRVGLSGGDEVGGKVHFSGVAANGGVGFATGAEAAFVAAVYFVAGRRVALRVGVPVQCQGARFPVDFKAHV